MKVGNYFELELENGTRVPVKFGTGAIELFCEINNCDLEFFDRLFDENSGMKLIDRMKAYRLALYAGAAYALQSTGQKVDFTEYTAADWIDQTGGYDGHGMKEVIKGLVGSIYAVDAKTLETQGEVVGAVSPLPEQS